MTDKYSAFAVTAVEPPRGMAAPHLFGNVAIINGNYITNPVSSRTGCLFTVRPSFYQTDEQKSRQEALLEQARVGSIKGIEHAFAEDALLSTDPDAVISLGLTIEVMLDYDVRADEDLEAEVQEGDTVILYNGPIIEIGVASTDEAPVGDAGESMLDKLAALRTNRMGAVKKKVLEAIGAYYALINDQAGNLAAASYGAPEDNMDTPQEDVLKARQIACQNAIISNVGAYAMRSKYMPEATEMRMDDLVPWIYESFARKDADNIMQTVVDFVNSVTAAIANDEFDDEDLEGAEPAPAE